MDRKKHFPHLGSEKQLGYLLKKRKKTVWLMVPEEGEPTLN